MNILDEVEETIGVVWWTTRVGNVPLLQHMPPVQGEVEHVGGEPGRDCLGKKGVNQHGHTSQLNILHS